MQLDFFGGPEYDVIEKGLDKLSVYLECAELVPAYVISMGAIFFFVRLKLSLIHLKSS